MIEKMIVAFAILGNSFAGASDWPAWRGPDGNGVSTDRNVPVHWSRTENVRWSLDLPDRGNSTPVVWKDRLFLTQATTATHRRELLCLDRASGRQVWSAGVTFTGNEPTHADNPYCSASPATDGKRVVVSYGSAGIYCYDFQGREVWHRDFGPMEHVWGNAASPVLWGDLCFINFGPGEQTFLAALDAKTGKTVWKQDEPGGNKGQDSRNWLGSWTTPVIAKTTAGTELLMSWPGRLASYDPKSGNQNWTCSGLTPLIYTSPLYSDGVVVSMAGYGGSAMAVKTGGKGDVTQTHRLWQTAKNKQRIGSGVVSGEHIYILDDPGVAECIELKTGKVVWEERVAGKGARNSNWSSLVLAEGRLYGLNQGGDTVVFEASPKFQLVAVNSLEEPSNSSVAIAQGDVFIRTWKKLWCISNASKNRAGAPAK